VTNDLYIGRKEQTRKKKYKSNTGKWLLIANLWMAYIIVLAVNYMAQDTYSYFNDISQIQNSFATAENFCADKDYAKEHKNICKCKDNSGLGNGSEECDEYEYDFGDEDNPGHPIYCPDDPNTPEVEICDDHPNKPKKSNNNVTVNENKETIESDTTAGENDSETQIEEVSKEQNVEQNNGNTTEDNVIHKNENNETQDEENLSKIDVVE
jgi:predicted ribosomally synthesized peptide with SipW-like signal peptide